MIRHFSTTPNKLFFRKLFGRQPAKDKIAETLAVKDQKVVTNEIPSQKSEKPKISEKIPQKVQEKVIEKTINIPEIIPSVETVQAYKSIEKRAQPIDKNAGHKRYQRLNVPK